MELREPVNFARSVSISPRRRVRANWSMSLSSMVCLFTARRETIKQFEFIYRSGYMLEAVE
jgi:hypothetical protein